MTPSLAPTTEHPPGARLIGWLMLAAAGLVIAAYLAFVFTLTSALHPHAHGPSTFPPPSNTSSQPIPTDKPTPASLQQLQNPAEQAQRYLTPLADTSMLPPAPDGASASRAWLTHQPQPQVVAFYALPQASDWQRAVEHYRQQLPDWSMHQRNQHMVVFEPPSSDMRNASNAPASPTALVLQGREIDNPLPAKNRRGLHLLVVLRYPLDVRLSPAPSAGETQP